MVVEAERLGRPITVGNDPRITRTGRTLRRFKLDELPQLLNVLATQMSLVGPRPEAQEYVDLYTIEQRPVLDLVPGITDPASIRYANESEILGRADDPDQLYISEVVPEKIRINLEYAAHASFLSDLRVILLTLARIAKG
jgi:lipopolysaccharide/colanic/teichoic acid biosynthesis glycosyltransferase